MTAKETSTADVSIQRPSVLTLTNSSGDQAQLTHREHFNTGENSIVDSVTMSNSTSNTDSGGTARLPRGTTFPGSQTKSKCSCC